MIGGCRYIGILLLTGLIAGCGGSGQVAGTATDGESTATTATGSGQQGVVLIGFDASEPLIAALSQGKIQGLVVQDPVRMGELSVKTMVKHLEKQPVEPRLGTGETLVTPENYKEPDIARLIHPIRAENSIGSSLSGARTKKWKVIVIPKGTTHEFWESLHAGTLKAATELGNVDVIWLGPQKEDERSQQIELVQSAVAAGVDGIVLAPLDAHALVEPVEAAAAKGIPVVVFDSGLETKKFVSFVATDNYHGGVLAARRMGKVLGGKGRVILLRYAVGSDSTEQPREGLHRHPRRGIPRPDAHLGHRVRRPDVRLGTGEGAEPAHAVPGPG